MSYKVLCRIRFCVVYGFIRIQKSDIQFVYGIVLYTVFCRINLSYTILSEYSSLIYNYQTIIIYIYNISIGIRISCTELIVYGIIRLH